MISTLFNYSRNASNATYGQQPYSPTKDNEDDNLLSLKRCHECSDNIQPNPKRFAGMYPTSSLTADTPQNLSALGRTRVLNDLIDALSNESMTPECFFKALENNGFEITNLTIFETILLRISNDRVNIIGQLLATISHDEEISSSLSPSIIAWLLSLNDDEILLVLTKKGVEFTHFDWSEQEEKHTLTQKNFVPLFFLTNFKNTSFALVKELIRSNRYDLIFRLFLCHENEKKWIATPFGTLEAIPLLNATITSFRQNPKIRQLFTTSIEHFPSDEMSLSQAVDIYRGFQDYKDRLEASDSDQELRENILNEIKNDEGLIFSILGFYYLIPILKKMLDSQQEGIVDLVLNLLTKKINGVNCLLQDRILFKIALPLLESFTETKNWKALENALTMRHLKGITPLFSKTNLQHVRPIIEKTLDCEQLSLVNALLSSGDEMGNTPIHQNLPEAMPLLNRLVELNHVDMAIDLLTKSNDFGYTPLHIYNNIFEATDTLITKLIEKQCFTHIQRLFSVFDETSKPPLFYNQIHDTAKSAKHLLRLVEKGQYELVDHFLSSDFIQQNTLVHVSLLFKHLVPVLIALADHNQFAIVEARLKARNTQNETPLHFAAHLEIAKPLFEKLEEKNQHSLLRRLYLMVSDCDLQSSCRQSHCMD